jgi:hypothetical protein
MMKNNYNLIFISLLILICHSTFAQQYVYFTKAEVRNLLRTNIGLTQWSITQQDSAARNAVGIHLSAETKIISSFINKKSEFAFHDAFYFDLNMGMMTSKQNTYKTETESSFSFTTNFGYLALAGYRNKQFGALGGIDFRWRMATVGGVSMPNLDGPLLYFSRPFVLRGEYCFSDANFDRRAIVMYWYDGGSDSRPTFQSVRLELPLGESGRWWLCGQYIYQAALSQDNFRILNPYNSTFNQWMIGLRVGSLP